MHPVEETEAGFAAEALKNLLTCFLYGSIPVFEALWGEGGIQYKSERQYDGIVMVVHLAGDAIVLDKCSAVVTIDTMYVANSTNCDWALAGASLIRNQ